MSGVAARGNLPVSYTQGITMTLKCTVQLKPLHVAYLRYSFQLHAYSLVFTYRVLSASLNSYAYVG